jgi:hypothetical protein
MCSRFLASIASVLVALAVSAQAADDRPVTMGDRVRITAPSVLTKRVEGTLAAVDRETLSVFSTAEGKKVEVRRSQITKLELTRGKMSRWRTGALIGAAWGVGFGVVLSNPPSSAEHFDVNGGAVAAGVLIGASPGGLIGAALHTDRWTSVSPGAVTLGIRPLPGHGVALATRVSF